MTELSR